MEVILLEKIVKLGDLGEKVSVKSGYGRNYLIPQKKAVPASEENLAVFNTRKSELENLAVEKLDAAKARAEIINGMSISLTAQVGEEGKLFGSIGVRDITEAMVSAGAAIEKSEVRMPEGPLREIGEFEVPIHLHSEVNAVLKVIVEAE